MKSNASELTAEPVFSSAAFSVSNTEQRLEALCELVDEELRGGLIGDQALAVYTRRITGDIDQAMTEETCWFDSIDFS